MSPLVTRPCAAHYGDQVSTGEFAFSLGVRSGWHTDSTASRRFDVLFTWLVVRNFQRREGEYADH
jgi:hypothetical protein